MKKVYKNKDLSLSLVARMLPFVARMSPAGCPSVAAKLPACCLRVADKLR
jgi:hypothetical protein